MKKLPLFQQMERQVEEEGKEWKRKRIQELIKELGEDEAEISPPQRKETGEEKTDGH